MLVLLWQEICWLYKASFCIFSTFFGTLEVCYAKTFSENIWVPHGLHVSVWTIPSLRACLIWTFSFAVSTSYIMLLFAEWFSTLAIIWLQIIFGIGGKKVRVAKDKILSFSQPKFTGYGMVLQIHYHMIFGICHTVLFINR